MTIDFSILLVPNFSIVLHTLYYTSDEIRWYIFKGSMWR